jgi:hypothetical protein
MKVIAKTIASKTKVGIRFLLNKNDFLNTINFPFGSLFLKKASLFFY